MKRGTLFYFISFLLLLSLGVGCNSKGTSFGDSEIVNHIPDTLRVGSLYSPTSYFIYKGEEMGYEYDLVSRFAADKKITVHMVIARNMESMIQMLDSGLVDVIAYEVPITAEYKNRVYHCGTQNINHQVLVQPTWKRDSLITDVTQLVGRDVYVEGGSKYESRLKNLDNEVGGGINIHTIKQDTLITEDLIEQVALGKLPLTIVDSDIARLNRTYFDNIDISLAVSFPQRASWAVNKNNKWLGDSINAWAGLSQNIITSKTLLKRYFELSKNTAVGNYHPDFKGGKISPYDHLFKHYAKEINWDWKLLAAQAYAESQFDTTAVSWAGARGIMQLMPRTAAAYGLLQNKITNPELNIKAAVASIKDINAQLEKRVPSKTERIKFIIAAYNSGIGHIYDAIELAKKYGKNPQKWDGNVEYTILLKSNPEYFNDEVCKFGYFKGTQTVNYVAKVQKIHELYRHKINKN